MLDLSIVLVTEAAAYLLVFSTSDVTHLPVRCRIRKQIQESVYVIEPRPQKMYYYLILIVLYDFLRLVNFSRAEPIRRG